MAKFEKKNELIISKQSDNFSCEQTYSLNMSDEVASIVCVGKINGLKVMQRYNWSVNETTTSFRTGAAVKA